MTTPLLKVTDLRAGYGKDEVLHGLSLEATKGSVITVIGPNGAGKSTFLNSLYKYKMLYYYCPATHSSV